MHFRVEATPPGPLAVIDELPDARLAILEGLNGIGKTLTVRLLQICTGTMPYRPGSAAWESLCDGLGDFEISVSGLEGADEIRWLGDSRHWPREGEAEPSVSWFDAVTIDGADASLQSVRQLLVVHRIAGDEGLIETFANFAEADAELVRRWGQRHAAPAGSALALLEARVGEALELLGEWSVDRYAGLQSSLAASKEELSAAVARRNQCEEHRQNAVAALELQSRLMDLRSRAPGLTAQLRQIDEDIARVRAERDQIERDLTLLAARSARAEPAERELRNARRTLDRNLGKLEDAMKYAAIAATAVGIEPDSAALERRISELEAESANLEAEQRELDAAPAMRELLDVVGGEFETAESQGLGSQIAIDDPETDIQLTVSQTRAGLSTRRSYLEGQPPPPQARELAERLSSIHDRLARCFALRQRLADVERFERLVSTNEDRVDRALLVDAGTTGDEVRALEERRRRNDEALLQLAAARAGIAQQLGPAEASSDEALSAQLEAARRRLHFGGSADELDGIAAEAKDEADAAQAAVAIAQDRQASLRRDAARARAEILRAAVALVESEALDWIRGEVQLPSRFRFEQTVDEAITYVEAARSLAMAVAERLGRHRIQLAAVERGLTSVAREIRGQRVDAIEYVSELRAWLGQEFSSWFNNPRVRHEILRDAEGDVIVNLNEREVRWTEASRPKARPLEAFSSGEQAFAYTRARLALLDEDAAASRNRLIVLDEFGAFIAHDRFQGLLEYLQERARERTRDQVLIVLPLSQDYAELSRSAVGSEAKRLHALADSVSTRKYAVRVLLP